MDMTPLIWICCISEHVSSSARHCDTKQAGTQIGIEIGIVGASAVGIVGATACGAAALEVTMVTSCRVATHVATAVAEKTLQFITIQPGSAQHTLTMVHRARSSTTAAFIEQ